MRRIKRKKWLGVSLIWVGGLLLVVFLLVAAFLLVEPNSVDDYSVQEPPVGANPGAVPYEQRPVQDLDDAESELAALENALEAYPAETLPKAVAALNAISIVVTMATNEARPTRTRNGSTYVRPSKRWTPHRLVPQVVTPS